MSGVKKAFAQVGMLAIILALLFCHAGGIEAQQSLLPIGAIQGATDASPYLNRFVNFRGVVVGRYEDVNTRGIVYHTLFVQDLDGMEDGDPATSDGIAVFLGRDPRPDIPLGARVRVGGKVTEFYGLTEIDDKGLVLAVEEPDGLLPSPAIIDPPADMTEQAVYFEALEGMRVAFGGGVVVSGPTHSGCGFAVIDEAAAAELPIIRLADDDPVGQVIPVLYPSDLQCDDIPQVKTGDKLARLEGTLTYNFDQFKIVIDSAEGLEIDPAGMPTIKPLPPTGPEQIIVASTNLKDYFDTVRDTEEAGEPVLTPNELGDRQTKLAYIVAHVLGCPTLLALQEVEHEALLIDLAGELREACGFAYQVSHLESPDARGIDNALLSDPRRVAVDGVMLRQTCSPVPTGIVDPAIHCEANQDPLFGRPPLQIQAHVDGKPFTVFVNHFKSKRGGEIETDLERIRQAVYLNSLAAELLAADPTARVIALGDFNDIELSPVLALLTSPSQGGRFTNALASIPLSERYTFNFGGVAESLDFILLSPALAQEIGWATIVHSNTDFPLSWRLDTSLQRLAFRISDHDIPVVALGHPPEPTAEPSPVPSPMPTSEPSPIHSPAPTAAVTANIPPPTTKPAAGELTPDSRPSASRTPTRWPVLVIGGILILLAAIAYIRLRN